MLQIGSLNTGKPFQLPDGALTQTFAIVAIRVSWLRRNGLVRTEGELVILNLL